jgi:hypothetical protein
MKTIHIFLITIFVAALTGLALAQPDPSTIISKMKTEMDLQDDQITNVTPVIEKYTAAYYELQKSIDDGTINPSAIDSQKKGIEDSETQDLSQYLKPDQLSKWRDMQDQLYQQQINEDDDANAEMDSDTYSNLPKTPGSN